MGTQLLIVYNSVFVPLEHLSYLPYSDFLPARISKIDIIQRLHQSGKVYPQCLLPNRVVSMEMLVVHVYLPEVITS